MAERQTRPSPEALLDTAEKEGRGRLKIFLGAAPGVGKTYEMLQSAQAKRREGVDLVVGVVETHGRRETEALLKDLEIIPRREVEYNGHRLTEIDLDAILKRRPQLVLVDELAHTNAEGSRHPKRYLDVEELLVAGIDVYSTLNVQHIESLNDVVARITRIRVRETVPDRLLNAADELELVALYVETDRHAGLTETERGHLAEATRLAERLGAEIVTLPGRSVVEEILAFARSRNATRVVLGKSQRSRWFELRHGSVVDEL